MAYEWWSIVPPIVAIGLAMATRRILVSLFVSVIVGALIWKVGNPIAATIAVCEDLLWKNLIDESHLRVFAFTLLMGAMIGVIHAAGGMRDLVNRLAPLARGRRGGQLMTWLLGLIVFIDDYANTLLLGTTMRSLTDRLRISREKLAYLVDSTAAPVSGLALISTWVAGEIGYIQEGYAQIDLPGPPVDGFAIFVETIPYRFYVLYALAFVPLVGLLQRDFGPMRKAERRAMNEGAVRGQETHAQQVRGPETRAQQSGAGSGDPRTTGGAGSGDPRTTQNPKHAAAQPDDATARRGHWLDAVVPVLVTVSMTVWLLYATGRRAAENDTEVSTLRWLIEVIGSGDSYLALVYGSLSGFLTACGMVAARRLLSAGELRLAALNGARQVVPALLILWLAWSLSTLTNEQHLGTGSFLGNLLGDAFDVRWMPTLVFLASSVVAFSTGTSWGTMGVLMPLVVPITYRMLTAGGGEISPQDPLMLASVGSVLAGAIFGDHCSPISDTTVLSSQASGCNHLDHVWTQMPYAVLVAAVAIVCGTVPVGFGFSAGYTLLAGLLALVALLVLLGHRSTDP